MSAKRMSWQLDSKHTPDAHRMTPCNVRLGQSCREATNQTEPQKERFAAKILHIYMLGKTIFHVLCVCPVSPSDKAGLALCHPTLWGGCRVNARNPTESLGILG